MKITWWGHAAVYIEGSRTVIIDPFLTGNPVAAITPDEIKGDAFTICKKTKATLVGIHEIAVMAQENGLEAEGMNIGGTIQVKGVTIHMVNALHSCDKGDPAGVVVETLSRWGYGINLRHEINRRIFPA